MSFEEKQNLQCAQCKKEIRKGQKAYYVKKADGSAVPCCSDGCARTLVCLEAGEVNRMACELLRQQFRVEEV